MSRLGCHFALIFLLFSQLLSGGSQGWAHGLRGQLAGEKIICATAHYDDGEAMAYGEVEISAPQSKLPFQSGRTDRNGVFCFQPDISGQWQITMGDEMGHQVRLAASVGADKVLAVVKDAAGRQVVMSRLVVAVAGIGWLVGLAGLWAWWQAKRR